MAAFAAALVPLIRTAIASGGRAFAARAGAGAAKAGAARAGAGAAASQGAAAAGGNGAKASIFASVAEGAGQKAGEGAFSFLMSTLKPQKSDLQPKSTIAGVEHKGVAGQMGQFGKDSVKGMVGPWAPVNAAKNIAKLPGLIQDWGTALVEGKKHLMNFNGVIAQTVLEGQRREILRNIESGRATGGSTKNLSSALEDLRDDLQPMKDVVSNNFNRVVTVLVRGVGLVVSIAEPLLKFIGKSDEAIAKYLGEDKADDTLFHDFVKGVADGKLKRDVRRPPRGQ